jgi:hypothetical protein
MFRKQNVPGIAAIHYALRDVDAGASDIRALVDVDHAAYRTAVPMRSRSSGCAFRARLISNAHSTGSSGLL